MVNVHTLSNFPASAQQASAFFVALTSYYAMCLSAQNHQASVHFIITSSGDKSQQ